MAQQNNEAIYEENIEGHCENQKETDKLLKKIFLVLLEKGRFFRMSP